MHAFRKIGTSIVFGLIMIALLLGAIWPTGLDFFLPEAWHYEHWPFALKTLGWIAVMVFFFWDASGKNLRAGRAESVDSRNPIK